MKASISYCFILLFFACKQPQLNQGQLSFKDSVVKEHLARIDSLDYYDTLNENYRILRAYINNDTGYFIRLRNSNRLYEEDLKKYPPLDTCAHLQRLSDLQVEEAYRFSHRQSFCYFSQRITITRRKDTIRLHYLEFSTPDEDGGLIEYIKAGRKIVIGPGCKVVKEFERLLSVEDWEGLQMKLYDADFWGLNPNYYATHMDGSIWEVEACKRNKWTSELEKTYSVYRHCSCGSAFKELGLYFLRLSGEKTMCEWFF